MAFEQISLNVDVPRLGVSSFHMNEGKWTQTVKTMIHRNYLVYGVPHVVCLYVISSVSSHLIEKFV